MPFSSKGLKPYECLPRLYGFENLGPGGGVGKVPILGLGALRSHPLVRTKSPIPAMQFSILPIKDFNIALANSLSVFCVVPGESGATRILTDEEYADKSGKFYFPPVSFQFTKINRINQSKKVV